MRHTREDMLLMLTSFVQDNKMEYAEEVYKLMESHFKEGALPPKGGVRKFTINFTEHTTDKDTITFEEISKLSKQSWPSVIYTHPDGREGIMNPSKPLEIHDGTEISAVNTDNA